MTVGIEGISIELGTETLSNKELSVQLGIKDDNELEKRTGVRIRRIAGRSDNAVTMAKRAAKKLFKNFGLKPKDFDGLIFCSQSPVKNIPGNASILHGELNLNQNSMAFDINLACSGYVYGLEIARSLVESSTCSRILFITSDTYTRFLHPKDRSTRGIFGEGATATAISAKKIKYEIVKSKLYTDGKKYKMFEACLDTSSGEITTNKIKMNGLGVLSFFNSVVPKAVTTSLDSLKILQSDVDLFIFHQASKLALDSLQAILKIPSDKFFVNISDKGNLVSSSIPVALADVISSEDYNDAKNIMLVGFGVGLSWGTVLLRKV